MFLNVTSTIHCGHVDLLFIISTWLSPSPDLNWCTASAASLKNALRVADIQTVFLTDSERSAQIVAFSSALTRLLSNEKCLHECITVMVRKKKNQ